MGQLGDFPNVLHIAETSVHPAWTSQEIVPDAETAQRFDHHETYLSLSALQGAQALEVIATALAGDPEMATLKADDAKAVVEALVEFFGADPS